MKKQLTALGIALLVAVGGYGATRPAQAQSSMESHGMSGSAMMQPAMEKAMDDLHAAMGSMKASGNTDKDYLTAMRALRQAMHSLMQAEMASGKNPQVKSATKKAMTMESEFDPTFGHLDEKFLAL